MELKSTAIEVLSSVGIESLQASADDSHVTLTLSDPRSYPMARKALRTAKLNVKRVGNMSLEVTAKLQEDEGEKDPFESLVSHWRSFVESNSSYRKAARTKIMSAHDSLEAARQISAFTLKLSKKTQSPFLKRMALLLKDAADNKDKKKVKALLADFSQSQQRLPKPVYRSPKEPSITQENDEVIQKQVVPEKTQKSTKVGSLINSAQRVILACAGDMGIDPGSLEETLPSGGKVFKIWLNSDDAQILVKTENKELAKKLWDYALKDSKTLMEREDEIGSGIGIGDEGMGDLMIDTSSVDASNHGFGQGEMNVPGRTATNLLRLAEQVIEHYAPGIHPQDLTKTDVKSWTEENAPDVSVDKLKATIDRVSGKGIPHRHSSKVAEQKLRSLESWKKEVENQGLKIKKMTHPSGEGHYYVAKDKEGNEKGTYIDGEGGIFANTRKSAAMKLISKEEWADILEKNPNGMMNSRLDPDVLKEGLATLSQAMKGGGTFIGGSYGYSWDSKVGRFRTSDGGTLPTGTTLYGMMVGWAMSEDSAQDLLESDPEYIKEHVTKRTNLRQDEVEERRF